MSTPQPHSPPHPPRTAQIARRLVLHIPGFDPRPPRHYREMYRTEGARQAAISGHKIEVGAAAGEPGLYSWAVTARIEGANTHTDIVLLTWNNLVRAGMARGMIATRLLMWRLIGLYLFSGAWWRLLRLRPAPMLATFYPVAMLLGQDALALALAAGGWALAGWPGALAGLAAGLGLIWQLYRRDRWFMVYYLLNDYGFAALGRRTWPEALRAQMAAAARMIAQRAAQVDEVLVIGHSLGAQLAVQLLAQMHREGTLPPHGPAISLLTLGQVIPMVSFLPGAGGLRRDLHQIACNPRIDWVDVSAPGDGGCFALSCPVAVSGVAPPDARGPLVLSAAFSQTLSDGGAQDGFFDRHFRYFRAFDRPNGYDYFAITAGPLDLAARFAGRAHSPSRDARPLSPWTDMQDD